MKRTAFSLLGLSCAILILCFSGSNPVRADLIVLRASGSEKPRTIRGEVKNGTGNKIVIVTEDGEQEVDEKDIVMLIAEDRKWTPPKVVVPKHITPDTRPRNGTVGKTDGPDQNDGNGGQNGSTDPNANGGVSTTDENGNEEDWNEFIPTGKGQGVSGYWPMAIGSQWVTKEGSLEISRTVYNSTVIGDRTVFAVKDVARDGTLQPRPLTKIIVVRKDETTGRTYYSRYNTRMDPEYRVLAEPVIEGASWETTPGYEKVVLAVGISFETDDGQVFDSCIKLVTRTKGGDIVEGSEKYFAYGVGEVSSDFKSHSEAVEIEKIPVVWKLYVPWIPEDGAAAPGKDSSSSGD